jgi:hypothetical protein
MDCSVSLRPGACHPKWLSITNLLFQATKQLSFNQPYEMVIKATKITDTSGKAIAGLDAFEFTLVKEDIVVHQYDKKHYSVTLRLRTKNDDDLPKGEAKTALEATKVNVSWKDEKGRETNAIFGQASIDPEDKCVVVRNLVLKGAFQFELFGTVEFKGLVCTGKIGGYKDGDDKGIYAYLQVAKPTPLTELITAAVQSKEEVDSLAIEEPSLLEKENQTAVSFYLKYGAGKNARDFVLQVDTQLKINKTPLDLTLAYYYYASTKQAQGETNQRRSGFRGLLKMSERHRFGLEFGSLEVDKVKTSYFLARYKYAGAISLKEIFQPLLPKDAEFPDITINDFQAFMLYSKKQEDGSGRFLLGIGAGLGFSLENLPLVGKKLREDKSFSLDKVQVLVSKGRFSAAELAGINGEPETGSAAKSGLFPKLEKDTMLGEEDAFRFHLSVDATIGGTPKNYVFSPGTKQLKADADQEKSEGKIPSAAPMGLPDNRAEEEESASIASIDGTVSASAKWVDIKKKLGPVNFQRIGFGYVNKSIVILLDASMNIAALGVELRGFGLGFALAWPPKLSNFYLDGLGISFKKDPIEISGAFLRATQKVNGQQVNVYSGAAILKLTKFTISGIGSYAKVKAKDEKGEDKSYTSLFIYAVYDGPIGGPVFFLVTGLAAGFGINRRVNVPPIDEVRDFPLVSLAMNNQKKSLMTILGDLLTPSPKTKKLPIEVSPGDYWLAVGIKFTSFKIINSFALLIVSFGNRLRFDILGLSVLSLPPKLGDDFDPLVYIELALKISFGSDSDVLSVEAMITPSSYVFSKTAKLRGGFALYIWVSGPHEGDFVITLGGYHPRFNKPAHYPNVDRLSLNWKVSSFVSLRGELYFALTPTAIMAGGLWEVTCDLGFLRASLRLWANMIISWAPFYYDIEIGVLVRIEANIKIAFILIHFKLELGAQLHIWGPPFAGEAQVKWIIFTFTIPFGSADRGRRPLLDWQAFSDKFLPPEKKQEEESSEDTGPGLQDRELQENQRSARVDANHGQDGPIDDSADTSSPTPNMADPLDIRIGSGIIEQIKRDKKTFVLVNPDELVLGVESFIPSTKVTYFGKKRESDDPEYVEMENDTRMEVSGDIIPANYGTRNKEKLGIKPMGVTKLKSTLQITLSKDESILAIRKEEIKLKGMAKGVPDALWSPYKEGENRKKGKTKAEPPESKVIKRVLTGVEISPAKREEPWANSVRVDRRAVEKDPEQIKKVCREMEESVYTSDPIQTINKSLTKERVLSIAGKLNDLGIWTFETNEIEVEKSRENAAYLFDEEPYIAKTGQKVPSKPVG